MVSPEPFSYDVVAYETKATDDAHPQALGAIGALFGLDPALPSRCRVLEIGCGDGENLFAMASYLPDADFVGFDVSAAAVARGKERLAALRLPNAHIEERSVTDPDLGFGTFDYVIAHGVYSWVPDAVKEALLRVTRASLSPHGLAFISFNALPGWEIAGALRAILRERTRGIDEPREKVRVALETARALAEADTNDGSFASALAKHAAGYLAQVVPAWGDLKTFVPYVFHDTLADLNDPIGIPAFAERAARHALRYMAESPLLFGRGDAFADALRWLDGRAATPEDLVACGALLEGVQFVGAVLCRDDAPARVTPDAGRARRLIVGSRAQRLPDAGDAARFGLAGSPLYVDVRSALGAAFFAHLAAVSPATVPVTSALDAARTASGSADAEDETLTALVTAIARQLVRPFIEAPPCVLTVSARPRAASFVLHHAADALRAKKPHATLVTATHLNMTLKALDLSVLAELDGTRDLDAIAERVGGAIAAGLVVLPAELAPLRSAPLASIRRMVEQLLAGHATLGLLVG